MDKVVCIVPGTLDQIRKLEVKVRTIVDLDERARRTEAGERDNQAALRVLQNHMKGSMVGCFTNDATVNTFIHLGTIDSPSQGGGAMGHCGLSTQRHPQGSYGDQWVTG